MKKTLIYVLGTSLIAVTGAANAALIYLECTTFNKPTNKTSNYSVTLDENNQVATFSQDTYFKGQTYRRPAAFTQTDVKYNWTMPGLGVTFYYRIDRTNMEFSQGFMGDEAKTDYGSCKISQPVDRKF